jgi:hypothetical protein
MSKFAAIETATGEVIATADSELDLNVKLGYMLTSEPYDVIDDYEECGDCGYDHAYEQEEAAREHALLEKLDGQRDGAFE